MNMVTYDALRKADLTRLHDALPAWRALPGQFKEIGRSYTRQVGKGLSGGDWDGKAADAARQKLTYVDRQIDAAAGEAADVHRVLDGAHETLKKCQRTLQRYKEEIDSDKNLTIDAQGKVSYDPKEESDLDAADAAARRRNYAEIVREYNSAIQKVLHRATETDETLGWYLRQDPNGRRQGFDSTGPNSFSAAREAREEASRAAAAFVKLASTDHRELSPEELKRANTYLRRHEGDPYFAGKMATDLGPRGALQFWQRNADIGWGDEERRKEVAKLQKFYGLTLATASQVDTGEMKEWKRDVIKLGSERFPDANLGSQGGSGSSRPGPYGFQIMSSLMRNGEYDKDFLYQYGKGYTHDGEKVQGLLEFDKKAAKDGSLVEFYNPDGYHSTLNYGAGSDRGMDPMAGYMEGLGRNPEAAQKLFYEKGFGVESEKVNPNLQYLLDREWPDGGPHAPGERGRGYDEFGHALEAATLGHPYDRPDMGLDRSIESTNVMRQIVQTVAADPDFFDESEKAGRQDLGDSIARMGAGYTDYLTWSIANESNSEVDVEVYNRAFGDPEQNDWKMNHQNATEFMRVVGGEEKGYDILSAAQSEFISSRVRMNPEADAVLHEAFAGNAQAHGILDGARVLSIKEEAEGNNEDKEREFSKVAEWKKYGWSQGAGLVSAVTEVALGGGARAAFAVPLVEAVTGAVETQQGIKIDEKLQEQTDEHNKKEDLEAKRERSDVLQAGKERVKEPFNAYISGNGHLTEGVAMWYSNAGSEIENAYSRGFNEVKDDE
ncbi:hypothetical protein E0L36_14700 [Streptomyces sp. AJS327]|uniref:hypothetical protein n=1 Tax=Streptomyces sp. AJS327 TaxID=2545265 RepID=UPI0015DF63C7|nr:hypothetical protein [Streptomyces sp. AJS327]MBA0052105.1 hypothetical protein [Streptomyces sp. AJS327]